MNKDNNIINLSNFYKLLTLYSPFNNIEIDLELLLNIDKGLTSLWYFYYFFNKCLFTETTNKNIVRHINRFNDKVLEGLNQSLITYNLLSAPYFVSTYYCPNNDNFIKSKLNLSIQNFLKPYFNFKFHNIDSKKIGIITAYWYKAHPVYRIFYKFIKELSKDYNLVLFNLNKSQNICDNLFNKIYNAPKEPIITDEISLNWIDWINSIYESKVKILFYCDVGMNLESIFLANIKLAPIQIAAYGHPVSTYGSCIDYFLVGKNVEVAPKYSENLLFLPNLAMSILNPKELLTEDNLSKINKVNKNKETIVINCIWSSRKINYQLLQALVEIKKNTNFEVIFRFFPGAGVNKYNSFIPFENNLKAILGKDAVEVISGRDYGDFLYILKQGHITIDSFPFGGFNNVIDSLFVRVPVVTLEGDKAYNRFASTVLKRLDLNELITYNYNDYISKVISIINNAEYLHTLQKKLEDLDLDTQLFNDDEHIHFKKLIDSLECVV